MLIPAPKFWVERGFHLEQESGVRRAAAAAGSKPQRTEAPAGNRVSPARNVVRGATTLRRNSEAATEAFRCASLAWRACLSTEGFWSRRAADCPGDQGRSE